MRPHLLRDLVLVKPEGVGRSPGGLHLAVKWQPPATGWVVTAGRKAVELGVRPGCRVAIRPYHGEELVVEGERLLLMRAAAADPDILGVFEP